MSSTDSVERDMEALALWFRTKPEPEPMRPGLHYWHPTAPPIRIVELPKEPLLSPDQWTRVKKSALRRLSETAEASMLAERKLARHWAGAAGGDKWEAQRYKRTGYRAE